MALKQRHENLEYSKFPATKQGARALGTQFYYTGKPCSRGHLELRYSSSGNCTECYDVFRKNTKGTFQTERSSTNVQIALDALTKGETTYIPENPCKHGHLLRYVGTNNCVQCNTISMAKRKAEGYSKWARIKKEYGLTKAAFYTLLERQSFKCPICGSPVSEDKSHVDHDHKTGVVRGVLCGPCNQGIGLLKEDIRVLSSAIAYLNTHS